MTLPFRKVLVANRGEIASRVIRTCKRLGIHSVAVHSEADAEALFVTEADEAIALGGNRVEESYLSLDKLRAAIVASGADALHPGYGMRSEDPRLCQMVEQAGARFIGPSPEALAALGDKITARGLARAVGLVPPPGTEQAVDARDEAALTEIANRITYPLMIKAAAGGGGIGMQRVNEPAELKAAVEKCVARSQAAFSDARVYIEHAIDHGRHIEVQVARARDGSSITLGDRECSAQRRHQKVLEESPSPAAFLAAELREELYVRARALLDSVGYVGIATVEFLADCGLATPQVYFLEVNARIQVEHPVTECVFDVDLVELQLSLAAGDSLPSALASRAARGHAVEVRLYAEDPARNFLPQPGTLARLRWPASDVATRIDAGYREGDVVTTFYDPLIAKLICHGPDRKSALLHLQKALQETELQIMGPKGPRHSNLELLRALVSSEALQSGDYDTRILEAGLPSP